MTDTEILSQMFKSSVLMKCGEEYGKRKVELVESQHPDSTVTIKHIPFDAFVIKSDRFTSPDNVFKGNNGECKRADYIIISEYKKCILYIEMKTTNDDLKTIIQQLKGSQCFIEYCQSIAKSFWNKADFLHEYQARFICFIHTGSIKKLKTQVTRDKGCHDTPEKVLKISGPKTQQFNRLAALGA